MKAILFHLCASFVGALNTYSLLLPTASPTITDEDPYQCATEYLPEYFKPPRSTGALSSELDSWWARLESEQPCTLTGTAILNCPFPDPTRWCAFPTIAPTDVLPAWAAYGSSASSWWSARSSAAISVAQMCPSGWFQAMWRTPVGAQRLNKTIAMSECYVEAGTTSASSSTTATKATSIQSPTQTAPAPSDPTSGTGRLMVDFAFCLIMSFLAAAALLVST